MLVAPIMNDAGVRDIYIPDGTWIDFFTGETVTGPVWLRSIKYPFDRFPVYVKNNSVIPLYPEVVSSTDEMDLAKIIKCNIDSSFSGIYQTLHDLFIKVHD